jgi:hypothetical protein
MTCPKCQGEVQPDWAVCPHCATPLQAAAIQPPNVTVQSEPLPTAAAQPQIGNAPGAPPPVAAAQSPFVSAPGQPSPAAAAESPFGNAPRQPLPPLITQAGPVSEPAPVKKNHAYSTVAWIVFIGALFGFNWYKSHPGSTGSGSTTGTTPVAAPAPTPTTPAAPASGPTPDTGPTPATAPATTPTSPATPATPTDGNPAQPATTPGSTTATWHKVLLIKGSADQTTDQFTVGGTWEVEWITAPQGDPGTFALSAVNTSSPNTPISIVNVSGKDHNRASESQAGTYYLTVTSNQLWAVEVEDYY